MTQKFVLFILFPILLSLSNAAQFNIVNSCSYTVWAAAVPGGGRQLDPGDMWIINVKPGTTGGRIWARTDCKFNSSGHGNCKTGDCGGLLSCTEPGKSPNTLAEYSLNADQDFYDISLVDGFNVPMEFRPTSNCHDIRCTASVNGQCPGRSRDDATRTITCPTGTNYIVVFCPNLLSLSHTAQFNIVNKCPYTVWAAAIPGGGKKLNTGDSWVISPNPRSTGGRIWARTGCSFNSSGHGSCQTGDCGGVLSCTGYGQPPNTIAEYALNGAQDFDYYDISLVDGFNVPMVFRPTSDCSDIQCTADVTGQCPSQLTAPGGCNNPCTVFKTNEYCCNSGNCGATNFSRYFKGLCPNAYSYPYDDATSTFTCPSGTYYYVVFCP